MTMRSLTLLFVFCCAACADTLVLHNGTRVTGRWWTTDADLVHFVVNGRLERYNRVDVFEIIFGDAPAAPIPLATNAAEPAAITVERPSGPPVVLPEQIGVVYFQDGRGNLLALEQTVAA